MRSITRAAGCLPWMLAAWLSFGQAFGQTPDEASTVELHAHLFMKEGMTWAFHGEFDGELQASSWRDRFHSQANPQSLEASQLAITVVALYAHPLMTWNLRDSIRRQMDLTEAFVRSHPKWVIARSATQAREALASNHRVLIYSLEGASGILESEEDFKEFIDTRGIRIVTPLHLTDDEFGGVAFLKGFRAMSSPFAYLFQLFSPAYEQDVRVNRHGLRERGKWLIEALMKRNVWIDLAHASDASAAEIIPELRQAGLPLLYTHTTLRRYLGAERGISDSQLDEVARSAGIVGLMPAVEMLEGTPVETRCQGSAQALALQYKEVALRLGAESVMLGSDYNGGVEHLRPDCPTGTALDDPRGLWNIGQVPAIWDALAKLGAPLPRPLSKMSERFLDTWARVQP